MSLRDNSTEGLLARAKRIELLFLFVFQLAFFFWIQFGFLAIFTAAFVFLIVAAHDGLSSSNNPFGVNCKRTPAVTIDVFSIARSRCATHG
jgi:hypothetical protein